MKRVFLSGSVTDEVELTGADARHIAYALRARVGDRFLATDAEKNSALMEIAGFFKDKIKFRLVEWLRDDTESPIRITLAISLLKGDKMDFVVQKATELGVSSIQAIESENCVPRYDEKKRASRREKWRKIADEAAKQCGRLLAPEIFPVTELSDWLKSLQNKTGAFFMCFENERSMTIRDFLKSSSETEYFVLIGPEGGFSDRESEAAKRAGFCTVSLGTRILRSETAALAAIAALQYEKGDL